MTVRDAFVSKAAAVALAAGLAYGGTALAASDPAVAPGTITTTQAAAEQADPGLSLISHSTYEFAPLLPYPMATIGGLAAVAALLAAYAATRRSQGVTLRTLFAVTAVGALMNPSLVHEVRESQKTVVGVLVDDSSSQNLQDRAAMTAETEQHLMERLAAMPGVEVRVAHTGNNLGGKRQGTHLFAALDSLLSDVAPERVGGVFVLSDGQIEDVPSRPDARLGGAPVHGLISGARDEKDRIVVMEQAPQYGVVDEETDLSFRVVDGGTGGAGGTVRVVVRNDGEVIDTRDVTPGETVSIKLKIPHAGPNIVEVQADALEGELTDVNNRAVVTVNGIRDKLKVLLVSGTPASMERSLRNVLKSDPAVDLVHFTILRSPAKQDGTPLDELALISFPADEVFNRKLDEFDLIIFDRYQRQGVIQPYYFQAMADYVEKGGAMLVIAGPEYASGSSLYLTPLGQILPVRPSGSVSQEEEFKPALTEKGRRHPVTGHLDGAGKDGADPSWGGWFRQVESQHASGDVVMQGRGEAPLLVLNREGKGRVAELMSDQMFLWARGHGGGGPYAETIQRTVHWLMGEETLEEEALRMSADGDKIVIERQTMADEAAPATLISPSGERQTVEFAPAEPGLFRAEIVAKERGLYRVEQGDKAAIANAGEPDPKEFADARATLDRLAPLAHETGGYVGFMKNPGGTLELPSIRAVSAGTATGGSFAGVRMTEASTLKSEDRTSLFPWIAGLATLFGLLAWYREGDGKLMRRDTWSAGTSNTAGVAAAPGTPKGATPS